MNTMTEAQFFACHSEPFDSAQGRLREESALAVTLADHERQRCEVWTRVMGYQRPVASFNIGKKAEHAERRFFCEARAAAHL
jgi:hypothetical protein